MSLLHHCVDLETGATVAVKIIEPITEIDELAATIFDRELNVRDLQHPNIVRLHEHGRLDTGQFYLVFDWIDQDLKTWIDQRRTVGADDFVEQIALPLISALAYAHDHQVVHRDVKPTNVLVTDFGVPKLTDFGISKVKRQLVDNSLTVVDFVSRPFAPPEGQHTSSYSRDVFSFGALMLWSLAEVPIRDYGDFADGLDSIDASPKLIDLIDQCVSLEESERPRNAVEVHARLEALQTGRRRNWIPRSDIYLELTRKAREGLEKEWGTSYAGVLERLKTDLSEPPAIARITNTKKRSDSERHYFIFGSSTRLHVVLDPPHSSVCLVIAAVTHPEQDCDRARDIHFVAESTNFVFQSPTSQTAAIGAAQGLVSDVEVFELTRADAREAQDSRRIFDQWRRQLDAREAHDRLSSRPLQFSDGKVDDFRLTVELDEAPDEDMVEQRRRIIDERGHSVGAGVVESVSGSRVVLYLDRELTRAPYSGSLPFDNSATQIKLTRERLALDAVRHQGAGLVNPRLTDLLVEPADSTPVERRGVGELAWIQELDPSKQDAVDAALCLEDFLLVEGPPGTGKTAFIAEVVAQTLTRDPSSRILVASQTNVALDNALARIVGLGRDISVLRIGNPSNPSVSKESQPFMVEERLRQWRARIEKKSESFLRSMASQADVPLDTLRAALGIRRLASLTTTMSHLDEQAKERKQRIERSRAIGVTPEDLLTEDDIELVHDELRGIADRRRKVQLEMKQLRADRLVKQSLDGSGDLSPEELTSLSTSLVGSRERSSMAPLLELQVDWIARLGRGADFYASLLLSTQVTAATCIGLTRFPGVENATFDICIVDEASKATATETLVPLVRARRWILVGDEKQLPPFQDEALSSDDLIREFSLDRSELGRSLFTRLSTGLPASNKVGLRTQYRMNDAIGDLISSCFYESQLENGDVRSPRWSESVQSKPVVWFDTQLLEDHVERRRSGESSFSNPCEVGQIIKHLKRLDFLLANQRIEANSISVLVLAPYAAQVASLQREVQKTRFECEALQIEVNTVDAAQGREADMLIFSATRSNESLNFGFLRDKPRANVALSRGRFVLSIFGDAQFFGQVDGPLSNVLSYIRATPAGCAVEALSP